MSFGETISNESGEGLKSSFLSLCAEAGSTDMRAAEEVFYQIARAHESATRYYHTLAHIAALLDFLDRMRPEIFDYTAVRLAAWLHDVVYDPMADDNEERSATFAGLALNKIGASQRLISRVAELILMTKAHEAPAGDEDAWVFLDGDLSILGADKSVYDSYAEAVRKEYACLTDKEYKEGRIKVLKPIFGRNRIYHTERAHRALEKRARANISYEIKKLTREKPDWKC